ncbi:Tafazzin [Madurella fahalii]|uniref:Tafazzin n=1 Tax=Madurella fahalii TaxID=1157608 RepID=A0ABQ0GG44_9PEZI
MPKKRHQNKYSKPQSTAPASLSSRANPHHGNITRHRSVPADFVVTFNQLLADLRRAGLSASGQQQAPDVVRPTVPPAIRQILQLPETPGPRPPRPVRIGPGGVRLPPGPAPPRSWLSGPGSAGGGGSRSRSSPCSPVKTKDYEQRPLPGMDLPGSGSLVDMVLRRFALDWEWQRSYCRYYLYDLPTHLRVALLRYLVVYTRDGVSLGDLQAVLLPPPDIDPSDQDEAYPQIPPSIANGSFRYLDLSNSLGRSLRLRELSDLLFPPQSNSAAAPLDSWDSVPDDDADDNNNPTPSVPLPLLPNLTHLSLALDPDLAPSSLPSWKHLLSFATHLPNLTHLSLAFWPEPTLTPNAKLATVVSPQTGRTVQYGGTGPYSHSLDNDWAEAVLVLRRLSRSLYGLEYLDVTGCAAWAPALWARASIGEGGGGGAEDERDAVDWARAWGKIEKVVMYPGYRLPQDAGVAETERYWGVVSHARRLERHVRAQREGKGRFFAVETVKQEVGVQIR